MTSILVYLFFFALIFIALYKDLEDRFLALFLSMIIFPACVALTQKPFMDPKLVLLYTFFAVEIFKHYNRLKEDIKSFPLIFPFALLIFSYAGTIITDTGFSVHGFYSGARQFINSYGFFLAAYITGRHCDIKSIGSRLFIPIILFCCLGIVEAALNANYPYKIICSAFPFYDGLYNLNTSINLSSDWRTRICITTKHPTTLGTLLSILFCFYLPQIKSLEYRKPKLVFFLLLLIFTTFLSGSRTALCCIGLVIFLYVLDYLRLSTKLIIISLCIFAAIYGINSFISTFSEKGRGSSLELRQEQLIFSYLQFKNSPYFGNGLGFIGEEIMERDTYGDRVNNGYGGLESIVFHLLIEQGLVGLLSFFFFFGYILYRCYRLRKKSEVAMQGFLITGTTIVFLILSGVIGTNNFFCYVLIGLCVGSSEQEKQNELLETENTVKEKSSTIDSIFPK